MTTAAEVIVEARTWIGTPFRHQGRKKGVGVDCAGLVIGVARTLGLSDADYIGYGRQPAGGLLPRLLAEHLDAIAAPEPAAVVLMAFGREPQHLGILTDVGTLIHAYESIAACVEHRFADVWGARVRAAYRFRGLG